MRNQTPNRKPRTRVLKTSPMTFIEAGAALIMSVLIAYLMIGA